MLAGIILKFNHNEIICCSNYQQMIFMSQVTNCRLVNLHLKWNQLSIGNQTNYVGQLTWYRWATVLVNHVLHRFPMSYSSSNCKAVFRMSVLRFISSCYVQCYFCRLVGFLSYYPSWNFRSHPFQKPNCSWNREHILRLKWFITTLPNMYKGSNDSYPHFPTCSTLITQLT